MLVCELAKSLAVGFRIRQDNRHAYFVVHELLKKFTGKAAFEVEELRRQIILVEDETASTEAHADDIGDVAQRAYGDS